MTCILYILIVLTFTTTFISVDYDISKNNNHAKDSH